MCVYERGGGAPFNCAHSLTSERETRRDKKRGAIVGGRNSPVFPNISLKSVKKSPLLSFYIARIYIRFLRKNYNLIRVL